ncbi:hypothetical protein D11S_2291 (plasmid) [Aggregatibacter actinomycetemcomitans D11S-1]|uniref:hypothetical protein n=1 Tax=Aggregatibacter actinomycetemcomitans TaxID=714 RepID=UPI0001BA1533|nr:hypothetical protein [Aggregatibacter actinomycetemcomitans]ACX80364.1 hypothetical protein D11S_2291 [Aggregatibacter actinomycetemcomitans D11S-1]
MSTIFELNAQEEPIILRFLDLAGSEEYEELIISETKISRDENLDLYNGVIKFFKDYGFYLEDVIVSSSIDDTQYFECDIEFPSNALYQELFDIFILNFGSDLFVRNIRDLKRDLKNGVREPFLRLYLPVLKF